MKVALLQLSAGQDKAANIAQAQAFVQEAIAKKASLIVLPEVFNFRGDSSRKEQFRSSQETIPGVSSEAFIPLAQKHKVAILLGSILEKAPRGCAYNTSVFIDSDGSISAKYRKIHLFDARIGDKIIKESDSFLAGRSGVTVKAGKFRIGLSICYDLRFPDLYQNYMHKGADVLAVPSCFTKKTGEAHWETLLRARAIENLSYVLAPNQVGMDARGTQAYGHSMIISPWGEVLACGSASKQEIIFGEIKIEEVKRARNILPGIVK